jgi:hypothetical protein
MAAVFVQGMEALGCLKGDRDFAGQAPGPANVFGGDVLAIAAIE